VGQAPTIFGRILIMRNKGMSTLVLLMLVATVSAVPPETGDVHHGRDIRFDNNEVSASIGGEFGFFFVYDETKEAGGGEAKHYPYFLVEGDVTHTLSMSDVLGIGFEFIEPSSALVDIDDERSNRVRAPGFFYGPQLRELRFYWRHTNEEELWELDFGRDKFLGYNSLFGDYQGSLPVFVRQTQYWDDGISLRHERWLDGQKLYGFRVSVLNSEGWVGIEDRWFNNSYFRFGGQGELHIFNLFGFGEEVWGDFSLLGSWTNAEGGSSPGAKEKFEHLIYGIQYNREVFGFDFTTRVLHGTAERGKNSINRHEETTFWSWENLLSGIEWGKSELDIYFSLADAQYDEGDPYWIWKGSSTFQEQFMVGAQIHNPFGVSERLSILGAYFQNNLDGERSWRALGDKGMWAGMKYEF